MSGYLTALTIATDGTIHHQRFGEPPGLEFLQQAVGGYIEQIPYFDRYDGEPCVAFCNENGKLDGLPNNPAGNIAWNRALAAQGIEHNPDWLCGPIVILFGDPKLMAAL